MAQQNREQILNTKFSPLRFGTSGVRAFIVDMSDMECYINTRGFIKYLYQINEIKINNQIVFGGDLRQSSPRIMKAVYQAIVDENCQPVFCGFIPTPTLSYYAWKRELPGIMVTGSHIPEDQNGIKFIKKNGEVLKDDENHILDNVAKVRKEEYSKNENESSFDTNGAFNKQIDLPLKSEEENAFLEFKERYTSIFPPNILTGKKIVLYEQSAVGRDLLKDILTSFGAEIISIERSDKFIPIDTEKIPDHVTNSLKKWAEEFKPFAIVSTDGDSDRPLLADENGNFLPGDLLGLLVSLYLKPDFVALPISSNDASIIALKNLNIEITLTKIGSPYVISAMNKKLTENNNAKVVAWERNGGYLLGSDWIINNKILKSLPTRDSILPLLITLIFATEEKSTTSNLINKKLPHRFIKANTIDNTIKGCEPYTASLGKIIINYFSPKKSDTIEINFTSNMSEEAQDIKSKIELYFNSSLDYSSVLSINYIDGLRISFENSDIVHLRPSSNAPEFRIYATANTEKRVDKILSDRLTILPMIIANTIKNNQKS